MNLSLEADLAEGDGREPSAPQLTPEQAFDRRWAVNGPRPERGATAHRSIRTPSASELFEALKAYSQPRNKIGTSYAEMAAALGLTESAVKSAVYRLRQRHRELLREEILQTVAAPGDVDDELRHLISVLGR